MREILFRGKRIDNGEWVYGTYLHQTLFYGDPVDDHWIIEHGEFDIDFYDAYRVISETVGQYTNLTDKNGKKIFEGDIVKGTFLGFPPPLQDYVLTIGWQEDVAGYGANYFENIEVIGNIHDNPELAKGGAE